jgi:hypothetical protein
MIYIYINICILYYTLMNIYIYTLMNIYINTKYMFIYICRAVPLVLPLRTPSRRGARERGGATEGVWGAWEASPL